MKHIKYLFYAIVCTVFASCMGDSYSDPEGIENPYGNNAIYETNVVTIAELKQMFATELATDYRDGGSYRKCTDNVQIKCWVTGNDVAGNIYNEVFVEDETGALSIAVAQGGMFAYLPVGTEILVDVKDLYVGNYGKHPEIGVPYTNANGQTYVSRMPRLLWNDHFKITGVKHEVTPTLFANGSTETTWNLDTDSGKLGIIRNVSFKNITPLSKWADPKGKASVSWYFNEQPATVMVYTSPYCDFADRALPTGKVNITGIVKRYNNNWEFLVRSLDDVVEL